MTSARANGMPASTTRRQKPDIIWLSVRPTSPASVTQALIALKAAGFMNASFQTNSRAATEEPAIRSCPQIPTPDQLCFTGFGRAGCRLSRIFADLTEGSAQIRHCSECQKEGVLPPASGEYFGELAMKVTG